jgi:hypothetical protein
VAVLSAQARTVRGQGPDGTRQGSGSLPDGLDGPRLKVGRSARAQGRRSSPVMSESRSREGPRRGGEILGFV